MLTRIGKRNAPAAATCVGYRFWQAATITKALAMVKRQHFRQLGVERLEQRLCMSFGAVDTTFGEEGFLRFSDVHTVESVDSALSAISLPDGSIVIVGNTEVGHGDVASFAKVDPTGQLDDTFGENGQVLLPQMIQHATLAAGTEGSIYVGALSLIGDAQQYMVMRLLADGSVDESFAGPGYRIFNSDYPIRLAPTSDGGVAVLTQELIGWNVPNEFRIWKLDSSGQLNSDFGTDGVTDVFDGSYRLSDTEARNNRNQFFPDDLGRLIVAGQVRNTVDGLDYLRLTRFSEQGNLDTTFGESGVFVEQVTVGLDWRMASELGSDGACIVSWIVTEQTWTKMYARRVHANGTVDTSFGTNGLLESPRLPPSINYSVGGSPVIMPFASGRTLLAVPVRESLFHYRYYAMVIDADGQFDNSYGDNGVGATASLDFAYVNTVGLLATTEGAARFAASGYDTTTFPPHDWHLFGLDATGAVDGSFGDGGQLTIDFTREVSYTRCFQLQPSGDSIMVLVGPSIYRRNPNTPKMDDGRIVMLQVSGETDESFGNSGSASLDTTVEARSFAWSPTHDGGTVTASITVANGTAYTVHRRDSSGELVDAFGDAGELRIPTAGTGHPYEPLLKLDEYGTLYLGMQTWDDMAWVAKADSEGGLLSQFGGDGVVFFEDRYGEMADFAVADDGGLFLLWTKRTNESHQFVAIQALDRQGLPVPAFGDAGVFSLELPSRGLALKIVRDLQGRLLILYRLDNQLHLHRITSSGHSDASFGQDGDVRLAGNARSYATHAQLSLFRNQPVVAATTGILETSTSVYFLNEDGTLDSGFGDDGTSVFDWGSYGERVRNLLVLPDASLLLAVETRDALNAYGLIAKLQGVENAAPLHNAAFPVNVSAPFDSFVSPRDVLLVIDYLNHVQQRSPASDDPVIYGFVDVSGDGVVSPRDALLVIDYLNRQSGEGERDAGAEGESGGVGAFGDDATGIFLLFWYNVLGEELLPTKLSTRWGRYRAG